MAWWHVYPFPSPGGEKLEPISWLIVLSYLSLFFSQREELGRAEKKNIWEQNAALSRRDARFDATQKRDEIFAPRRHERAEGWAEWLTSVASFDCGREGWPVMQLEDESFRGESAARVKSRFRKRIMNNYHIHFRFEFNTPQDNRSFRIISRAPSFLLSFLNALLRFFYTRWTLLTLCSFIHFNFSLQWTNEQRYEDTFLLNSILLSLHFKSDFKKENTIPLLINASSFDLERLFLKYYRKHYRWKRKWIQPRI